MNVGYMMDKKQCFPLRQIFLRNVKRAVNTHVPPLSYCTKSGQWASCAAGVCILGRRKRLQPDAWSTKFEQCLLSNVQLQLPFKTGVGTRPNNDDSGHGLVALLRCWPVQRQRSVGHRRIPEFVNGLIGVD